MIGMPQEYRVPAVADGAKWEFSRALQVLITGLGDQEFILRERFTMADILLGHLVNWATKIPITIEDQKIMAYKERLFTRPAFLRARAREKQEK